MTSYPMLREAWQAFVDTHQGDLDYVPDPKYRRDVDEPLIDGAYNLVLPSEEGLQKMLEAKFLLWACMEKRQVIQVANRMGINGRDRIMVTTAGGPESRERRQDAAVEFWSELFMYTGGNIVAAYLVHDAGCGGAKVQETERVVREWQEKGIEANMMRARADETRRKVLRRSTLRQVIDVGVAHINPGTNEFEHIAW